MIMLSPFFRSQTPERGKAGASAVVDFKRTIFNMGPKAVGPASVPRRV